MYAHAVRARFQSTGGPGGPRTRDLHNAIVARSRLRYRPRLVPSAGSAPACSAMWKRRDPAPPRGQRYGNRRVQFARAVALRPSLAGQHRDLNPARHCEKVLLIQVSFACTPVLSGYATISNGPEVRVELTTFRLQDGCASNCATPANWRPGRVLPPRPRL